MKNTENMQDLMFAVHRAELEASLACGHSGENLPDLRNESKVKVDANTMAAFNLGVTAGVHGLLRQLSDEKYTINNADGCIINQIDACGEETTYAEQFTQWLDVGYDKDESDPASVFERNKHRNFAASSALEGMVYEEEPE